MKYYRCQNCDFEGYLENDELCPDCKEEYCLIEFRQMTDKDHKILDRFFEQADCVQSNYKEAAPYCYFWDNYDDVANLLKENPKLYLYTLIDAEDNEAYIYKGRSIVNRIGYFVARNEVKLPDDCIRYW